jgi:hypothetical protein
MYKIVMTGEIITREQMNEKLLSFFPITGRNGIGSKV